MARVRFVQQWRRPLLLRKEKQRMDEPEDVPQSMVFRTVVVLVLLPAALAMVAGGIVGYSINGVPGAIGAGLFFGFAAVFGGAFLYWLVGPIETPSWPIISLALVVVLALIILLLV